MVCSYVFLMASKMSCDLVFVHCYIFVTVRKSAFNLVMFLL